MAEIRGIKPPLTPPQEENFELVTLGSPAQYKRDFIVIKIPV